MNIELSCFVLVSFGKSSDEFMYFLCVSLFCALFNVFALFIDPVFLSFFQFLSHKLVCSSVFFSAFLAVVLLFFLLPSFIAQVQDVVCYPWFMFLSLATNYFLCCFTDPLIEAGSQLLDVFIQDFEGCKSSTDLCFKDLSNFGVSQCLQVELDSGICRLLSFLQFHFHHKQYKVVVAAYVCSWVGFCFSFDHT